MRACGDGDSERAAELKESVEFEEVEPRILGGGIGMKDVIRLS